MYPHEKEGQKQAAWRTDPARSGAGTSVLVNHLADESDVIGADVATTESEDLLHAESQPQNDVERTSHCGIANGSRHHTFTGKCLPAPPVPELNGIFIQIFFDEQLMRFRFIHNDKFDFLIVFPPFLPAQENFTDFFRGEFICRYALISDQVKISENAGCEEKMQHGKCGDG